MMEIDKEYTVVVSVRLAYKVAAKSEEHALDIVANVELPSEYVEDSFELVNISPKD